MDENRDIHILFNKYIDNTLSKKEFKSFMQALNDPEESRYIEDLMQLHWKRFSEEDKSTYANEVDGILERYRRISEKIEIVEQLQEDEERSTEQNKLGNRMFNLAHKGERRNSGTLLTRFPKIGILRLAATVVLFLGTALLINYLVPSNGQVTSIPAPQTTDAVTLKLHDGMVKVISPDRDEELTDAEGQVLGTQEGTRLNYEKGETAKELVYNELTVPYGNRFDLVLSDGTEVMLNAGSSIRYPVRFANKGIRKVFLKGEAYFDVVENTERPFVVHTDEIDVEVLGTKFNISFYPEDEHLNTVLVEGSVKVSSVNGVSGIEDALILAPEQMASWNKEQNEMMVSNVDTELYTAWKNGFLLFRKSSFISIRKKLERHFDIVIRNEYPLLERQVYTASFEDESIDDILEAFQVDTPFEYEYTDAKTITLTRN